MHIYVNGRNIEITDAIKSYVKEKIGKVANHYDQIQGIEVVLSVIKNPSASANTLRKFCARPTAAQLKPKKQQNLCMQVLTCLPISWTDK